MKKRYEVEYVTSDERRGQAVIKADKYSIEGRYVEFYNKNTKIASIINPQSIRELPREVV